MIILVSLPSLTSRSDQSGGLVTASGEGSEGSWRNLVYCNSGTYVTGYRQRVDDEWSFDRTAMNSVEMSCSDYSGNNAHTINSHGGFWGSWYNYEYCPSKSEYKNFMTGYKILEGPDETGAHGMGGLCLSGEPIEAPGKYTDDPGNWRDWGYCPGGTAICGFQSKMESEQGGGNDSALNHVRVACCRLCDFSGGQYLDGNICQVCHYTCKTCSGGGQNQCTSCFFTSSHVHALSGSCTAQICN
jgi:hypothetical protein